MKRPYSSRTRPSPVNERGSASVTVLLLFVVFSGLGLAMLHASGVHMKINAFRKVSALLDCASENGLKRGGRGPSGRRAGRTGGRLARKP